MSIKDSGRLIAQATRVFGDLDQADRWLRQPSRALGGETPLRALHTATGAALVERELRRLADERPDDGGAPRAAA